MTTPTAQVPLSKPSSSERALRLINTGIVILGALIASAGLCLHAVLLAMRLGDPWETGDWLISYAGGPVRRGLLGSALLLVGSAEQVSWTVAVLQCLLVLLLFGSTVALFLGTNRAPVWMMLVLSPAFLLFPAMAPVGGLRKELLALAALALLACVVRFGLPHAWMWVSIALFAVGAFSHEVVALTAPAFVFLLLSAERSGLLTTRRARHLVIGVVSIAAVGLAFAAAFPGRDGGAAARCAALTDRGFDAVMCTQALDYLGAPLSRGLSDVQREWPAYAVYGVLALLALLPLVLAGAQRRHWLLLGISYLCLLPLFLTGVDYGRWVYVGTASVSIALLATWRIDGVRPHRVPEVAALAFVLLWSMNYYGAAAQPPLISRVVKDYGAEWTAVIDATEVPGQPAGTG